jgi:predicted membrane protein
MHIPVIDLELNQPTRSSLAWYGGVGTMATIGVIEWPLAAVIVASHLISQNSRSAAVSGAAAGASDAAG